MPLSRIVIRNASVLTLDDRDTFLYPGTVVIENDRIVAINEGYNDTLPLWEYLDTVWYPSIRSLTPTTAHTAALHSYITALKSGTTTVNDMYRFVPSLASAAAVTGIRATLSNDVALPAHRLDTLADNLASFAAVDGMEGGRVRCWLGVEWVPLADEALLKEVGRAKRALGTGVHIHLCESKSEVQDAAKRFGGKSPVRLAYEAGILGPDCVAAHCVHVSDDDIKLLAETGTSLGSGVLPLQKLLEAGCHNSTDMFETLKLGSYMQRAVHQDAELGTARQLLRMATTNGAKALGLEDVGTLEVGKKADLIVLDLKRDMMFTPLLRGPPEERRKMLESHLVFGCNGTAVDTVIVDGRVVVEGRKVLGVDEEKVREDVEVLFESLVSEMEKQSVKGNFEEEVEEE
ncbi:Metallo-dependent hydrolase [Saccharata proteae CBS 121410]|uniref:Metallo-dependent hydrolase n=1 Tax=Saccharata proteae CBS 121410 TaxID=1314787 RepID=A0A9P4LWH8_9PEZI|nr:Metallo-dependent hydrolase [Saccharata proteae CBS 121410]